MQSERNCRGKKKNQKSKLRGWRWCLFGRKAWEFGQGEEDKAFEVIFRKGWIFRYQLLGQRIRQDVRNAKWIGEKNDGPLAEMQSLLGSEEEPWMWSKETQLPPPWSAHPSALQAQLLLAPQCSLPEAIEASLELSPFSGRSLCVAETRNLHFARVQFSGAGSTQTLAKAQRYKTLN